MTILVIGPVERVRSLMDLDRYDEHIKAYSHELRLRLIGGPYNLHVIDYCLHRATKDLTNAQRK